MMQLPAAKRFAAGSFCPRGLKMLTRAAVFGTLDARDSGGDRREFMYITYKTAMQLYDLGFHSFWQEPPSRDNQRHQCTEIARWKKKRPHIENLCHCEERSDVAIRFPWVGSTFSCGA